MGGLVIADTLRAILATPTPTSPTILGLIAYDTPYWGLNPKIFASTAEKYLGYAQTGHAVLTGLGVGAGIWGAAWGANKADGPVPPTASPPAGYADPKRKETTSTSTVATATPATAAGSSWFKVAGAAAALAGVAAGAAYYGKDAVSYGKEAVTSSTAALAGHLDWAKSHLSFVGELWATDALESRLEEIERATGDGVGFHWCAPALWVWCQTLTALSQLLHPPSQDRRLPLHLPNIHRPSSLGTHRGLVQPKHERACRRRDRCARRDVHGR